MARYLCIVSWAALVTAITPVPSFAQVNRGYHSTHSKSSPTRPPSDIIADVDEVTDVVSFSATVWESNKKEPYESVILTYSGDEHFFGIVMYSYDGINTEPSLRVGDNVVDLGESMVYRNKARSYRLDRSVVEQIVSGHPLVVSLNSRAFSLPKARIIARDLLGQVDQAYPPIRVAGKTAPYGAIKTVIDPVTDGVTVTSFLLKIKLEYQDYLCGFVYNSDTDMYAFVVASSIALQDDPILRIDQNPAIEFDHPTNDSNIQSRVYHIDRELIRNVSLAHRILIRQGNHTYNPKKASVISAVFLAEVDKIKRDAAKHAQLSTSR